MVHPDNRISFHTKKKWLRKDMANLKCIFLSERSQSVKGYILYDSNDMAFRKMQNYGESMVKNQCFSGVKDWEGWIGKNSRYLWQWNHSVWSYNDGYIPLYICSHP